MTHTSLFATSPSPSLVEWPLICITVRSTQSFHIWENHPSIPFLSASLFARHYSLSLSLFSSLLFFPSKSEWIIKVLMGNDDTIVSTLIFLVICWISECPRFHCSFHVVLHLSFDLHFKFVFQTLNNVHCCYNVKLGPTTSSCSSATQQHTTVKHPTANGTNSS